MTKSCPTQRAPDVATAPRRRWWESARFQAVSLVRAGFRQSGVLSSHLVVEPVETHQRVTLAVSPLPKKYVLVASIKYSDTA